MKTESTNLPAADPVVIADECGDTLWDEVLLQDINVCGVNTVSANNGSLQQHFPSDLVANNLKK